jgi:ABC-type uncharacterized transport system permease subunit
MPSSITGLLQSTLLFFLLTSDVFIQYRIRFRSATPQGASA